MVPTLVAELKEDSVWLPAQWWASEKAFKNSFIILHALDTTADSATELSIYSPDAIHWRAPIQLLWLDQQQLTKTIKLQPIVEALESAKTAALPAFHVLAGADNTGSFSAKRETDLLERICRGQKVDL